MKTRIIPEKCIACGLCQVLAPQTFDYTDNGIVLFATDPNSLEKEITSDQQLAVMEAYKECPTRAIIIEKSK